MNSEATDGKCLVFTKKIQGKNCGFQNQNFVFQKCDILLCVILEFDQFSKMFLLGENASIFDGCDTRFRETPIASVIEL